MSRLIVSTVVVLAVVLGFGLTAQMQSSTVPPPQGSDMDAESFVEQVTKLLELSPDEAEWLSESLQTAWDQGIALWLTSGEYGLAKAHLFADQIAEAIESGLTLEEAFDQVFSASQEEPDNFGELAAIRYHQFQNQYRTQDGDGDCCLEQARDRDRDRDRNRDREQNSVPDGTPANGDDTDGDTTPQKTPNQSSQSAKAGK